MHHSTLAFDNWSLITILWKLPQIHKHSRAGHITKKKLRISSRCSDILSVLADLKSSQRKSRISKLLSSQSKVNSQYETDVSLRLTALFTATSYVLY